MHKSYEVQLSACTDGSCQKEGGSGQRPELSERPRNHQNHGFVTIATDSCVALPHGLPPFTSIRKVLWQSQRATTSNRIQAVATPSNPQNPECSASDRSYALLARRFLPRGVTDSALMLGGEPR